MIRMHHEKCPGDRQRGREARIGKQLTLAEIAERRAVYPAQGKRAKSITRAVGMMMDLRPYRSSRTTVSCFC